MCCIQHLLTAFASLFWDIYPRPNPTSRFIMRAFILLHSSVYSCRLGQQRWGWVRVADAAWRYPAVWICVFLWYVCGCDLQMQSQTKCQYGSNTKKHPRASMCTAPYSVHSLSSQANAFYIKSSPCPQVGFVFGKIECMMGRATFIWPVFLVHITHHLSPSSLCFIPSHCCLKLFFHLFPCDIYASALSLSTPSSCAGGCLPYCIMNTWGNLRVCSQSLCHPLSATSIKHERNHGNVLLTQLPPCRSTELWGIIWPRSGSSSATMIQYYPRYNYIFGQNCNF